MVIAPGFGCDNGRFGQQERARLACALGVVIADNGEDRDVISVDTVAREWGKGDTVAEAHAPNLDRLEKFGSRRNG